MCKHPSLCRLSLPSSMLVVVNALRRRPPVNKSDRRRARVTSKSHWIPIRVTLQGSQTWMRYRISKCSFTLQTVLDRRYIALIVESELLQHIAGTGWTEGVFTTSLTVSLLPYPAFVSWLFWAATSKMWRPFKYVFLWKSQIAVQTEQMIDVEKKINPKMYCFFFFCRLFPITSARLFIQPGWA